MNELDRLARKFFEEHLEPNGFTDATVERDFLLIISEVIEAFDGERKGDVESEKLPGFSAIEEEMADVIIRVLSASHLHGWRIGEAVEAKHKFNLSRPYKHGKKF